MSDKESLLYSINTLNVVVTHKTLKGVRGRYLFVFCVNLIEAKLTQNNSYLSLSGEWVYSDRKQTDVVSSLDPIQLLCLYGLRDTMNQAVL